MSLVFMDLLLHRQVVSDHEPKNPEDKQREREKRTKVEI